MLRILRGCRSICMEVLSLRCWGWCFRSSRDWRRCAGLARGWSMGAGTCLGFIVWWRRVWCFTCTTLGISGQIFCGGIVLLRAWCIATPTKAAAVGVGDGATAPRWGCWDSDLRVEPSRDLREDCDEEKDDSPGCGAASLRDQETDAAGDLCCAAEQDKLAVGWKIIRHDAHVGAGHEEVTRACRHIKHGHYTRPSRMFYSVRYRSAETV